MDPKISAARSPLDNDITVKVSYESFIMGPQFVEAVFRKTIEEIATKISERYVSEHYAEIVSKVTPEAVATLTMGAAAAAIRESIETKFPDKIVEVVRKETEVWQRGLLGGITRVR